MAVVVEADMFSPFFTILMPCTFILLHTFQRIFVCGGINRPFYCIFLIYFLWLLVTYVKYLNLLKFSYILINLNFYFKKIDSKINFKVNFRNKFLTMNNILIKIYYAVSTTKGVSLFLT